jgi:hypothetical protein
MNMILEKYIPLDKSWIIRMGVLDIINDRDDMVNFLRYKKDLSDDLLALKKASETWNKDVPIDIGESGTLYRFLQFVSWKLGLQKKLIKNGTLKRRIITNDATIVSLPLRKLLKLDNGTSQWASAAVLAGNKEILADAPYKLKLSYEAVEHWNKMRTAGKCWESRRDPTIEKQARAFLMMKNKKSFFIPEHTEDYCFARVFGFINTAEGERRWPSLRGHESDRIKETEKMLKKAKGGIEVDSKDHRVIQAIAMYGDLNAMQVRFSFPEAVNKSWPQFWDFLKESWES